MDDKKNYYYNCHDGYHNPHCWCNDNYCGGGEKWDVPASFINLCIKMQR